MKGRIRCNCDDVSNEIECCKKYYLFRYEVQESCI